MTQAEEQQPEHLPGPRDTQSQAPYAIDSSRRGGLLGWFNRRRNREEKINQLQTGYQELVGLMQGIRDHMDTQADNQKRLAVVLGQMPEAVNSLKTLGESAERQSEVLGLVKDQLAVNAQRDEQVVNSIDRFNDTLQVMDKTSKRSADTIAQLTERARESELQLRSMLERSEKRLIYLISLLIALILIVVGLTVGYTLIPRDREPQKQPVEVVAPALTPTPVDAEEINSPSDRSIGILEAVKKEEHPTEDIRPIVEETLEEEPAMSAQASDAKLPEMTTEEDKITTPSESVVEEDPTAEVADVPVAEEAVATEVDAPAEDVAPVVEAQPLQPVQPAAPEKTSFWSRLKKSDETP